MGVLFGIVTHPPRVNRRRSPLLVSNFIDQGYDVLDRSVRQNIVGRTKYVSSTLTDPAEHLAYIPPCFLSRSEEDFGGESAARRPHLPYFL